MSIEKNCTQNISPTGTGNTDSISEVNPDKRLITLRNIIKVICCAVSILFSTLRWTILPATFLAVALAPPSVPLAAGLLIGYVGFGGAANIFRAIAAACDADLIT